MRCVTFVSVWTEGLVMSCMCKRRLPVSHSVPVSFSSPLVRLCGVWVDADGSVTVSYGRVGFLHLDINADSKKKRRPITITGSQSDAGVCSLWRLIARDTTAVWLNVYCDARTLTESHLALLAYRTARQGFNLMASVKRSRAFWRSPKRKNSLVCDIMSDVSIYLITTQTV